MLGIATALLLFAVLAAAFPKDLVLGKWSEGIRYDYETTDDGDLQLVDNWIKLGDYDRLAKYNPGASNRYHLFTRANSDVNQVLVMSNPATVIGSNFNVRRRTIILMHGFAGSVTSGFNTVLVRDFLQAIDCNVIVLDWSDGSSYGPRAIQAAQAAGRFVNWLIDLTGLFPSQIHIVGYSVGGHGAGIMARTINGAVNYVTACDPADRWDSAWVFKASDGEYTEVIHTNVGNMGMTQPLADVDFYPNGGRNMPGCVTALCDHYRSYYYLGESIRTGGFTGTRCEDLNAALTGNCNSLGTLRLGGLQPKIGNTGIFYVRTNANWPFSQERNFLGSFIPRKFIDIAGDMELRA